LGSYENVLAAFRRYDKDRSNTLSWSELHQLMVDTNAATAGAWTEGDTDVLLKELDKSRDNKVDIDELVAHIFKRQDAMGGTSGSSEYEIVLEAFRRYDSNRNGTLCKQEFHRLMGSLKPGWTEEHTKKVFSVVDKDNSGEVDSSELVAWLFGIPAERSQAARKAERTREAEKSFGKFEKKSKEAGPMVVVEIVTGSSGITAVDNLAARWKRKLGASVEVAKVVSASAGGISRVSARNGNVVFWDMATMMAHRENPFHSERSAREWERDMESRHIPRLLAGT